MSFFLSFPLLPFLALPSPFVVRLLSFSSPSFPLLRPFVPSFAAFRFLFCGLLSTFCGLSFSLSGPPLRFSLLCCLSGPLLPLPRFLLFRPCSAAFLLAFPCRRFFRLPVSPFRVVFSSSFSSPSPIVSPSLPPCLPLSPSPFPFPSPLVSPSLPF